MKTELALCYCAKANALLVERLPAYWQGPPVRNLCVLTFSNATQDTMNLSRLMYY